MHSGERDRGYMVIGKPIVVERYKVHQDSPGTICTACGLLYCHMTELGRQIGVLADERSERPTILPTGIESCVWHQKAPAEHVLTEEQLTAIREQLDGMAKLLYLLGWPDLAARYAALAAQEKPDLTSLFVDFDSGEDGDDESLELFREPNTVGDEVQFEEDAMETEDTQRSRFALTDPAAPSVCEESGSLDDMSVLERNTSAETKKLLQLLDTALDHFEFFVDLAPPWKTNMKEEVELELTNDRELLRLLPQQLSSIRITLVPELSDVIFEPEHPELWSFYLPEDQAAIHEELVHAQIIIWLLWLTRNSSDAVRLKLSKTISDTALEYFQLHEDGPLIQTLKSRIKMQEYIQYFSPNGYHELNEI